MIRSSFVLRSLFLGALLTTSFAAIAPPAHAQGNVSAGDRKAARELFNAGLQLQNSGKFADALDKFSRAQAVINAPTNLLHIAECQAALGQLVEATETYRQLAAYPLDDNAPDVFKQAKDQGAKESKQIDASRIPELKIDVQPKDVPSLTVTIDDKPINSALVGVSRPVNPGAHKVNASAPGYTPSEQTVDVKEREHKAITLTLVSNGGVVIGPATGTGTEPTNGTTPPPSNGTTPATPPPSPPMKPQDQGSKLGIWVGPRLGLYLPAGSLPGYSVSGLPIASDAAGNGAKLSDLVGAGGDIGIEGAFRFAKVFYVGAYLEGAAFGGKKYNGNFYGVDYGTDADSKGATALLLASLGYISSPSATVAFLMDLGVGYRALNISINGNGHDDSYSYGGIELHAGVGVPVLAGQHIRIIPKIEWDLGAFASDTSQLKGGSSTSGISSTVEGHSFFFLGVGGYFNMDLDKHDPPK